MEFNNKKRCSKCQEMLDIEYFSTHRSGGLRSRCKKCRVIEQTEYAHTHREAIKIKKAKHYLINKKRILDKSSAYYKANRGEVLKKTACKYQLNKEAKRVYQRQYEARRRHMDLEFRMSCNLRGRLWHALKNNQKSGKTLDYLGCSIKAFKLYLECQFKEGMSWENYGRGGWDIDHILPCSSFDHSDEEQIKRCWNYKNLQPMWHIDNIKKGSKTDSHTPQLLNKGERHGCNN